MNYNDLNGLKFKQNEKIHVTTIDKEMGFMNVDKGQYYAANEVGTEIWNILSQPKGINEIVCVLLKEYDIEKEQCQTEVEEFIRVMLDQQLILCISAD